MKLPIELQLMRTVGSEWLPRSRPSRGYLNLGEGGPSHIKLYPGAAAEAMENMIVTLDEATRILSSWASVKAVFQIDGQPFGEPRPGFVFLGLTDYYTGIIHFPIVANDSNKMFRGFHSLQMRVVDDV